MLTTYQVQGIKKGIHHAVDSFNIIWKNKIILLYLAIPTALSVLFFLGFYNIMLFDTKIVREEHTGILSGFIEIIEHCIYAPSWFHYLVKMAFLYAILFITIVCDGALIWHTKQLLEKKDITLLASLHHSIAHYGIMSVWAVISMIEIIIQQKRTELLAHNYYWFISPIYLMSFLLTIGWALLTFFVVQIIICERYTNIIEVIIKSGMHAKNLFFIIIGGELWFGLITLCIISIPALVITSHSLSPFPLILSIITLILGVKSVLATAQTLFKTIIYK